MKAQQAFRDVDKGLPPKIPNDIFKPSNPGEEIKDELSIFGGKTHTLTAKSTSTSVPTSGPGANSPSGSIKSRLPSDSPKMLADNPSFEGVHPSLVSELHRFNGLIESQSKNAYKMGGEVFGGGPMVVDGGSRRQGSSSSGGGGEVHHHQPTKMHVARQQQHQQPSHQQPQQQYQQQHPQQPQAMNQHFDRQEAERLEWQREQETAANYEMEMERQAAERQELARQQQLHQQRELQRQQAHEQEIQRQQQHEFLRQQQQQQQAQQEMIQQQQMQDHYRQQIETQQLQLRQQQQQQAVPQYRQQHHSYDQDQQCQPQEPDHGMMASASLSSHVSSHHQPIQRQLSHSQSQPNIHQAYQQQQQHYQPLMHLDTPSSYEPSPPTQRVSQRTQQQISHSPLGQQPQQQHSMYAVSPEYSQYSSPESIHARSSYVTTHGVVPPTTISATSSSSSYVGYWPATSSSFVMPDQQPTSASSGAGSGSAVTYGTSTTIPCMQMPRHYQQYTPEGALRGIAADDRSLQETWQSYMSKVNLNCHGCQVIYGRLLTLYFFPCRLALHVSS